MIRLFLAITSFLVVSLTGLWYGFFGEPIAETAFENEAIATVPSTTDNELIAGVPSATSEEASVAKAENTPPPLPETSKAVPADIPSGEIPESKPVEKTLSTNLSIEPHLLRFGYRLPPVFRTIDTIVLHSSYNASGGDEYDLEKTISQYETYSVGAHYIIDRKGVIYRLVEEANIAYHAGSSKMTDGRKNVNDFSIGIEMIANLEDGYTEKQYAAVNDLIADIKTRYKIKSVVGHGDIAPSRKTDPWKFDWKKLK